MTRTARKSLWLVALVVQYACAALLVLGMYCWGWDPVTAEWLNR